MRKKRSKLLLVVFPMISALGLCLYPFIANCLFESRSSSLIQTLNESVKNTKDETRQEMLRQAREYNRFLNNGTFQLRDPFSQEVTRNEAGDYRHILCINEDGVMGLIRIPAIDVTLPVYHGTSESTLKIGAGHLEGSSLPVGGESTHAVITGHTGLSSARLFTDLSSLETGDYFFLDILNEKLAYQVDQIKTVLPGALEDLQIIPGKDYCTLITCTPYGVNTHRLLVRGKRTSYEEAAANPKNFSAKKYKSKWMTEYLRDLLISFTAFIICVTSLHIVRHLRKL